MRRGKSARLAPLFLAMALLTACGGPEPEATPEPTPSPFPEETAEPMPFALACYPNGGFHPITGSSSINLTLAPLMYRGLFALDRQFQPRNDLCVSCSVSEDGLSWTFVLADAAFSDGSPLTGTEAAASLNLARQSTRYAGRLADIRQVTAGDGQVTVSLSRPNGALPSLLDVPIVKETGSADRPLGTGPYFLTGEGENLKLTARAGAGVPLEEIPLQAVGDSDDLVYAFDAREISLVNTDLTGTNVLGYSGRFETTDYPTSTLLYVGFNTRSGACQDETVRRALSRAFDREAISGTLMAGHAVPAVLPIHPGAAEYDAALAESLGYDPAAARELLSQAGWTGQEGEKLRRGRSALQLKLVVNQENTYKVSVAESLAGSLESLGCAVTVEKLPWENFLAALESGSFDLYLGETTMTADFDPEPLVGEGGSLNYGGFQDAGVDELLNIWRGASGEARKEAASQLYQRIAQLAPIAPVCFKNGSVLTQWGQITGLAPTQRDVFAGLEKWNIVQF